MKIDLTKKLSLLASTACILAATVPLPACMSADAATRDLSNSTLQSSDSEDSTDAPPTITINPNPLYGFYTAKSSASHNTGEPGWVRIESTSQEDAVFFDQQSRFFRCITEKESVSEITTGIGPKNTSSISTYCYSGFYSYEISDGMVFTSLNIDRLTRNGIEEEVSADQQFSLPLSTANADLPMIQSPFGSILDYSEPLERYTYSIDKVLNTFNHALGAMDLTYNTASGLLVEESTLAETQSITGIYTTDQLNDVEFVFDDGANFKNQFGNIKGDAIMYLGSDGRFTACYEFRENYSDMDLNTVLAAQGTWSIDLDGSMYLHVSATNYELYDELPLNEDLNVNQITEYQYSISTLVVREFTFPGRDGAFLLGMKKISDSSTLQQYDNQLNSCMAAFG